ncbi:unnamed protein product, partial [Symbiodinium necroappetens]
MISAESRKKRFSLNGPTSKAHDDLFAKVPLGSSGKYLKESFPGVSAAGTTLYVFILLPVSWILENYAEPQPLPWVVLATCLGRGCRPELRAMPRRLPRRPCAA